MAYHGVDAQRVNAEVRKNGSNVDGSEARVDHHTGTARAGPRKPLHILILLARQEPAAGSAQRGPSENVPNEMLVCRDAGTADERRHHISRGAVLPSVAFVQSRRGGEARGG